MSSIDPHCTTIAVVMHVPCLYIQCLRGQWKPASAVPIRIRWGGRTYVCPSWDIPFTSDFPNRVIEMAFLKCTIPFAVLWSDCRSCYGLWRCRLLYVPYCVSPDRQQRSHNVPSIHIIVRGHFPWLRKEPVCAHGLVHIKRIVCGNLVLSAGENAKICNCIVTLVVPAVCVCQSALSRVSLKATATFIINYAGSRGK